ncbi:AAA family ATPase, partial [Candidatus Saganbacteria bacterium]|nr:AAA family ATPase [Candidatus Saganbacteria bacterium]
FNYHLTGLEQDEVEPYITQRLQAAGRIPPLFTAEAVALLFNYAKGLPRIINTLAYEALYVATDQKKTMIDESLIENIIQE